MYTQCLHQCHDVRVPNLPITKEKENNARTTSRNLHCCQIRGSYHSKMVSQSQGLYSLSPVHKLILNCHTEYVPPTQSLKKYMYAQPAMQRKNFLKQHGADKKLGHHLQHLSSTAKASGVKSFEHDDLLLNHNNAGMIQVEDELERTWRIKQDEIIEASAIGAASKNFSLKLDDFGPYAVDYTRNGR